MLESLWGEYQAIASDIDRLETQHSELERTVPPAGAPEAVVRRADLARAELRERIDLRANDARSVAAATLGLTRGTPDPRLVEALSTRLRRDLERARSTGDVVRVKVLAETRLELLDDFSSRSSGRRMRKHCSVRPWRKRLPRPNGASPVVDAPFGDLRSAAR